MKTVLVFSWMRETTDVFSVTLADCWFLWESDANLYNVAVKLTWRTHPLSTRTPCCSTAQQGWNTKSLSVRDASPKIKLFPQNRGSQASFTSLSLEEDLVQTTDFIVHFWKNSDTEIQKLTSRSKDNLWSRGKYSGTQGFNRNTLTP